jgi:hypothetical protein
LESGVLGSPRTSRSIAQWYFGLTAVVAVAGVSVNGIVAWRDTEAVGRFSPGLFRLLNTFAFFTIESNLLVCVTASLLFLNPVRPSPLFRWFWLVGLTAITITGIGYHWLLSEDHDPAGLADLGNTIVHYLVPIMAVAGFAAFGPRRMVTARLVATTPLFLVLWGAFTLVRGELTDPAWYPYPFVDVAAKGWGRVIANGIGLAALYLAVAFAFLILDRRLSSRRSEPAAAA